MAYVPAANVNALDEIVASRIQRIIDNQASFNDGTGIGDNAIQSRHIDWADTGGGDNGGIWWEELGRTVLTGDATSISVASLPTRKYLMIIASAIPSGVITQQIRFNNDSGTNYSYRYSFDGGADSTGTSQAQGIWSPNGAAVLCQAVMFVTNIAAQEKIVTCIGGDNGAAGAGNAPGRWEVTFKWANTSNAISRVDILTASNNYAAGSSLIVLGHD